MGSVVAASKLSGQEVLNGYAQITSSFVYSTDNTVQDISGLTITFTPLQARVLLKMGGATVSQTVTASSPFVQLVDSANTLYVAAQETLITGALSFDFATREAPLSLTPGTSYTFKLRTGRGLAGASQVSVNASATQPVWIQAVYL